MLLAAFITGLRTTIQDSFDASGPSNFVITRFDFTAAQAERDARPWWMNPAITPREADRLGQVPGVQEALYNFQFQSTVEFEDRRIPAVESQGHAAGWTSYAQGDFTAGRNFTEAEVRESRPVVVISAPLAQELFGNRDPIGRRISMADTQRNQRVEFTVVGVFEPAPNIFTTVVKYFAVVPYSAASKRLHHSDDQAQILIVPRPGLLLSQVHDAVIAQMRSIRGLGPREENDFALIESASILAVINRFTSIIFLVMLALTSAALMVGGVGVIGIMLISVTERTQEIGIRKALGATRREILWQFLVEASLLTVAGAVVGMAGGGGLAALIAHLTPLPARVPLVGDRHRACDGVHHGYAVRPASRDPGLATRARGRPTARVSG
jgi:putative ABC transport system permease protein